MTHDYPAGLQIVANSILGGVNAEIAGSIVLPAQTGQREKRPAGDFPLKPVSSICISNLHKEHLFGSLVKDN
jgi:hypothetical protein